MCHITLAPFFLGGALMDGLQNHEVLSCHTANGLIPDEVLVLPEWMLPHLIRSCDADTRGQYLLVRSVSGVPKSSRHPVTPGFLGDWSSLAVSPEWHETHP